MIQMVTVFRDGEGRRIEAMSEYGAALPVFTAFRGFGGYSVRMPQGEVQMPVQFDIPAGSVAEAFKAYDAVGRRACEAHMKEMQAKHVRNRLAGG